ncbi:uncharacterized protein LOC6541180 [Drosophila erecta]|uniref:SAM domain-containing protein n=1 Tax=Drosophila erecta TaxID=7220 RepID=B3N9H2_DROER|nr:uncharacterized protein LOC6541180 [Drosophila erecta]EDV57429.2 uncharacterized protein Dere_GG24547 [Drosophila erecta]
MILFENLPLLTDSKATKTHTMSAGDVPLVAMAKMPPPIQFEATKDFHTHTQQQELDVAFLGNERRPWIRPKDHKDTRREREILNGLLSSTSVETDNASTCVDKLIAENISYRDLASLTDEDLKFLGFNSEKYRQQLLEMFGKMPNQNPSYKYTCNHPEAETYNNQILGNAGNHFMSLRASLAVTNYKLQVSTPEDVVVGDKRYASCFAQETLKSVKQITEEIAQDLRKIEANAKNTTSHKKMQANENHKKKKWSLATILYYTTLAVGFSCAWFWWWTKFRSAPRLEHNEAFNSCIPLF